MFCVFEIEGSLDVGYWDLISLTWWGFGEWSLGCGQFEMVGHRDVIYFKMVGHQGVVTLKRWGHKRGDVVTWKSWG